MGRQRGGSTSPGDDGAGSAPTYGGCCTSSTMDAVSELKLPAWGGSRPPPSFAWAWHMGELTAIDDGELGGSRSTFDHNPDVLQDLDSQGCLCGQPPGRRRQPKEGFLRCSFSTGREVPPSWVVLVCLL
ncbi:hypothetical protein VPH35_067023 [Triticum aestivum]